MCDIKVITADFVVVNITKSDAENAPPVERRFKKDISIADFKAKLELVTGALPATMKLKLFDDRNTFICDILDDNALLGSYPIDDGFRIHVIDNFILTKDFVEGDVAERFQLSEEDYTKKQDTVRAFLQKNRLGKYNEEEMKQLKEKQEAEAKEEERLASLIAVGSRCEVSVPRQATRRGTVKFNGPLAGTQKPGIFIGVQYDEPLGKNDGTIDGKRFFECPPKYGGFVKPAHVVVGDFPVEEYNIDDEM